MQIVKTIKSPASRCKNRVALLMWSFLTCHGAPNIIADARFLCYPQGTILLDIFSANRAPQARLDHAQNSRQAWQTQINGRSAEAACARLCSGDKVKS